MEQVTKLTNLEPLPNYASPEGPTDVKGSAVHPRFSWVRLEWRIVYTTVGLDAAFARVCVLDGKDGKTIDEVNAFVYNDRVWSMNGASRMMDRNEFGRRRLAMETLDALTREIDASGWRGLSQRPKGGDA
jgi:hypothetical protein